jgi:hypothetical protein
VDVDPPEVGSIKVRLCVSAHPRGFFGSARRGFASRRRGTQYGMETWWFRHVVLELVV